MMTKPNQPEPTFPADSGRQPEDHRWPVNALGPDPRATGRRPTATNTACPRKRHSRTATIHLHDDGAPPAHRDSGQAARDCPRAYLARRPRGENGGRHDAAISQPGPAFRGLVPLSLPPGSGDGVDWGGDDFERTADIAATVVSKLWRRALRTLEVDVDHALLRAMVRNVAVDLYRTHRRQHRHREPTIAARLQHDDHQCVRRGQIRQCLDEVVSSLPRRERAVINLILDGASLRETGAELGISRQKAGRLKRRAIARIRLTFEMLALGVLPDDARTVGRTNDARGADEQADRSSRADRRDAAAIRHHIAQAWSGSPGRVDFS